MTLTEEQKHVIDEFVALAKNNSGIVELDNCRLQMLYDFKYGKEKAIELLDDYYNDLIAKVPFSDREIERLDEIVARRNREWRLVKDINQFNWKDVVFDGLGYVVLKGGNRLDIEPDLYKEERENFNYRKKKQHFAAKTN